MIHAQTDGPSHLSEQTTMQNSVIGRDLDYKPFR